MTSKYEISFRTIKSFIRRTCPRGEYGVFIANINPIRYRSYYYDTETGWYYLQSRYYDPAVGRFISPDDPSLLGANGDLLSYNLYAYCSNNPVNYSDPSGQGIFTTIFIITIFSAIDGGMSAYYAGQDFWKGFAAGAFSGVVGGGLAAFFPGMSFLCKVGLRGGTSLLYGVVNENLQNGSISNNAWGLICLDVVFDMFLSTHYIDSVPIPKTSKKILKEVLPIMYGSSLDSLIDITQTCLLYTPIIQSQYSNVPNLKSPNPSNTSSTPLFESIFL